MAYFQECQDQDTSKGVSKRPFTYSVYNSPEQLILIIWVRDEGDEVNPENVLEVIQYSMIELEVHLLGKLSPILCIPMPHSSKNNKNKNSNTENILSFLRIYCNESWVVLKSSN